MFHNTRLLSRTISSKPRLLSALVWAKCSSLLLGLNPNPLYKLLLLACPKNVAVKFVVFFISIRQRPVGWIEFDSAQILRLKLRQRRRFVHDDNCFLAFICGEIIHKQPGCGGMP